MSDVTRRMIPHNPHAVDNVSEEVSALLNLYGVTKCAVVNRKLYVQKVFEWEGAEEKGIAGVRTTSRKTITAANAGPLDAPIEYWQLLCETLLVYARKNGYPK